MKKKYLISLILFGFLTFSAAGSETVVQKITEANKKDYRLIQQTRIQLTGPAAPAPVAASRLIYSGKPLHSLMKDNPQLSDVPEFADIVLIPANSAFRPDKALALSEPESDPAAADFFFRQFGIEWRNLKSNLTYYTVYVGRNKDYYCFANSSLLFLVHLQKLLNLEGGFSPMEMLADALGNDSVDSFTADAAALKLTEYGDAALPFVEQAVADTLALDENVHRHTFVLFRIGTKSAREMINAYTESGMDKRLSQAIFAAILDNKAEHPGLKSTYGKMLEQQVGIKEMIELYRKMGWQEELLAACRKITERPKTFTNYREAVIVLEKISPENIKTYNDLEEDIRRQLLRGGDMPRSTSYHVAGESDSAREQRLREEDEKRIRPLQVLLLRGPSPEMAVLAGLSLALMDDTKAPYSVKKYVGRVRSAGIEILRAHQGDAGAKVTRLLERLIKYSTDEREKALLQDTARRIGSGK